MRSRLFEVVMTWFCVLGTLLSSISPTQRLALCIGCVDDAGDFAIEAACRSPGARDFVGSLEAPQNVDTSPSKPVVQRRDDCSCIDIPISFGDSRSTVGSKFTHLDIGHSITICAVALPPSMPGRLTAAGQRIWAEPPNSLAEVCRPRGVVLRI